MIQADHSFEKGEHNFYTNGFIRKCPMQILINIHDRIPFSLQLLISLSRLWLAQKYSRRHSLRVPHHEIELEIMWSCDDETYSITTKPNSTIHSTSTIFHYHNHFSKYLWKPWFCVSRGGSKVAAKRKKTQKKQISHLQNSLDLYPVDYQSFKSFVKLTLPKK